MGMFYGVSTVLLFTTGWILSIASIVLAIYAKSKQKPGFESIAKILAYIITGLASVAWLAGLLGILLP